MAPDTNNGREFRRNDVARFANGVSLIRRPADARMEATARQRRRDMGSDRTVAVPGLGVRRKLRAEMVSLAHDGPFLPGDARKAMQERNRKKRASNGKLQKHNIRRPDTSNGRVMGDALACQFLLAGASLPGGSAADRRLHRLPLYHPFLMFCKM